MNNSKNSNQPTSSIEEAIQKVLLAESDFAFEMRALSILSKLNFKCEHSGTYADQITKKDRQFDIKAVKNKGNDLTLAMTVECKNLSPKSPLVIHSSMRRNIEAFHKIVECKPDRTVSAYSGHSTITFRPNETRYSRGAWTGKAMDRVFEAKPGEFKKGDDAFDKMSQALASAKAMLQAEVTSMKPNTFLAVVPMLLVPDETLWEVRYNEDGEIESPPTRVKSIQFYLGNETTYQGRAMTHGLGDQTNHFSFSHLEICTESFLDPLVRELCFGSSTPSRYFPRTIFGEEI